jgi:hypothetical protein
VTLLALNHSYVYFTCTLDTGGGWFAFGADPSLQLESTLFQDNAASCCYASGYGSKLLSNATLTCSDTDSGESRGDCCYGNQYSDGESCVTCKQGLSCSVIGASLATQSLVKGYWRASAASTDVRPCWFPGACAGNTNKTVAAATIAEHNNCTTTTSYSRYNSSVYSSNGNTLVEHSGGCNIASTSTASIAQVEVTTYCAQGYKGPCQY